MDALPLELLEYVRHGREERNLEYKETLALQGGETKAKLAKEIMAFSNIRDGGVIVIGVKSDGTPVGMSQEVAGQFTKDAVAAAVADYAAPYIELEVTLGHDGTALAQYYAVIQIKEFSEIPVLCKRDFGTVIRHGAIYTRSRRINEAAEIRTEAEMRELIEMAVDKGIRAFNRRGAHVGASLPSGPSAHEIYERQLGGL